MGVPIAELPDNARIVATTLKNPSLPAQLADLLHEVDGDDAPRAHLNILMFNDRMELQIDKCRIIPVPQMPTGNTNWVMLDPSFTGGISGYDGGVVSDGPGYIMVYVDNQSIGKDVWFDNVRIQHYRGEVLEENHYYPYGLTLQTSQAAGAADQPYKLTTKELEKHFDLNTYDFGARAYPMDGVTWWQPDPLAEKYYSISPYAYCANNPVRYFDPDGKEIWINFGKSQRVRYNDGQLYNQDGSSYTGKVKGFLNNGVKALDKIATTAEGKKMISALSTSGNIFEIKSITENPKNRTEFVASDNVKASGEIIKSNPGMAKSYQDRKIDVEGGSGGTIYWNTSGVPLPTTAGTQTNATTDLAHEMGHGYDANRGVSSSFRINNLSTDEYQASYRENIIRKQMGLPLRTTYGTTDENSNPIQVPLLDENSEPFLPKEAIK